MSYQGPPKWSKKLLRILIHDEYLEEIEGDMEEVFQDDLLRYSLRKARLRYSHGVFKLLRLSLIKNVKWIYKIGIIITLMRTLRLAFRNLLKFKNHTAINLIGLSLGLSIGSLILLYVMDELSFDNFHIKGDRIFKVVTASPDGGMETNAHPIGHQLRNNYPEVESVLYVTTASSSFKLNHKDQRFKHNILYASEEFFELFDFPLISGNLTDALKDPYSIVITKSIENTYYNGSAYGKTLTLRDSIDFKITGVVADVPKNSHIQFDMLISFSTYQDFRYFSYTEGWGNFDMRNYILLKEGTNPSLFQEKISNLYNENIGDWLKEMGVEVSIQLIPLKDIYLSSSFWNGLGPNGSMKQVKTVALIAIFLMLLAIINYVNLSTARSAYRSKEVAMKKIVGANRRSIIVQFMTESLLITIIAFFISILLIIGVLPFFNELMIKHYHLSDFFNPTFITGLVTLIILVAFLSGYYPSLIIARLKPLTALTGKLDKAYQGMRLRKILIVFQFFISTSLVLATLLVINQLSYMRNQDLGFDKEQIIIVDASNLPRTSKRKILKTAMEGLVGVQKISYSNALPGRPGWRGQWAYPEDKEGVQVDTEYMTIDEDYIDVLGLQLIAGDNFNASKTAELKEGLVINETCVEQMGWNGPEDAIGKRITSPSGTPEGIVIGVVKDYHGLGLQEKIWAQAMDYNSDQYGRYFAIRYDASKTYELIKGIEQTWNSTYPSFPVVYYFLDEDFERQYKKENQLAQVLSIFTFIIIVVSIIGLLGIISFVALSRTKEVGIRKIMGANISQIIVSLSREFVLLVLIGNSLAIPLIWHYGNQWLNGFAYHTTINPILFIIAILITGMIAFLIIALQTYKTAKSNPVEALRYE